MNSKKGMSLVEVLVTVAVFAISMTAITSMLTSQQRFSAQLADKLASLDLERNLTNVLANGSVCTYMVNNMPPGFTLNPMALTDVTTPNFANIPSRGLAGATPAVVGDGVTLASTMSPRLSANRIRIENIQCAVLPCTADTNQFNAQMTVAFDTSKTAGPVSQLSFPVALTTAGPPGVKTITNCAIGAGGGPATIDRVVINSAAESCGGSPGHPNCPAVPPFVQALCPAGYEVTGCGYELSTWAPTVSGDPNPGDDYHTNAPDDVRVIGSGAGNGCEVDAGGGPGCGVCFRAQAICIRIQ